jgi:methionine-rich copper-binding protein CopC
MVARFALGLCVALAASPVWACGVLLSADPKVGSARGDLVDHISATFSEAVIPAASSMELLDAQGRAVSTGKPAVSHEDSVLSITLAHPLPPGHYRVRWNLRWKDCDAQMTGGYPFTVAPPP